ILDDCLSAVDSVTEQAILRGLREHLRDRTAIIVSHRVAALSLADRILVLDEGAVVEEGTHDQLVARGGLYAEIHDRHRLDAESGALRARPPPPPPTARPRPARRRATTTTRRWTSRSSTTSARCGAC